MFSGLETSLHTLLRIATNRVHATNRIHRATRTLPRIARNSTAHVSLPTLPLVGARIRPLRPSIALSAFYINQRVFAIGAEVDGSSVAGALNLL